MTSEQQAVPVAQDWYATWIAACARYNSFINRDSDSIFEAGWNAALAALPCKSGEGAELPEVMPGHWSSTGGLAMAMATLDDPHMACSRERISDFALANEVYLSPGIANLTDAKERIRWLSASLAVALSTPSEQFAKSSPDAEFVDFAAIDAVIEEMIGVAVNDGEDGTGATDFDRGDVDRWQAKLQIATGHKDGFPSRTSSPDAVGSGGIPYGSWDTARIKTAIESKLNGLWSWLSSLDGGEVDAGEAQKQIALVDGALKNLADIPDAAGSGGEALHIRARKADEVAKRTAGDDLPDATQTREAEGVDTFLSWRGGVEGYDQSLKVATKELGDEAKARSVLWLIGLDHVWKHVDALRAALNGRGGA